MIVLKQNIPREASCCFLPLPGGRPLRRFSAGVLDPGEELAVAESLKETGPGPSGPYLRGLPLFFFRGSPEEEGGIPPPTGEEEPMLVA